MNGNTITRALATAGFTAAAGLATMLGTTAAHAAPAADGKPIAYVRAGVIYKSTNGTDEVRLTEDEVNARPRFSPDGSRLAYLHNGMVWVMDADGNGKHQVTCTSASRTWTAARRSRSSGRRSRRSGDNIEGMRLGTLNLMHGRSLADGLVDAERVRAAIAGLDADVLGLQEVDRGQPRSGHADLARIAADALGARDVLFVPAVVGTPGERFRAATDADGDGTDPHYGVALVSRFPVLEWRATRLPASPLRAPIMIPGPKRARLLLLDDEPRVLIAAVVATPIGRVTIATTHLSFVPGWNIRQLRIVRRVLRGMPAPRVLLADLNLPGGLPRLFSGWHRLAGVPTYPAPAPRVQFDHVLADPRGAERLPGVAGVASPHLPFSDHRPLIVTLRNRPGTLQID